VTDYAIADPLTVPATEEAKAGAIVDTAREAPLNGSVY